MKKRILSFFLAILLLLTVLPVSNVFAAEDMKGYATDFTDSDETVSGWALDELVKGQYYGVYPVSWDDKDMTAPITQGQIRILLAQFRLKILNTDCVTKNPDTIYSFSKKITVEKIIDTFYTMLTGMEFTSDIGINGKTALKFMKDNGIYTGTNGELKLTDACSIEQACVIAIRLVTYVYDKLDAASKGFLWVTKSGGNTVYMLGSIHLATTDIYPLSEDIIKAYESSDALVEELDALNIKGAMSVASLGMYTDGTSLKDHVSAETYKKVIELGALYGYKEDILSLFKPWYLYSIFSSLAYTGNGDGEAADEASSLGIDMNFLVNAYLTGKPVMEVEGYEFQAKVLDSFSDELEEYLLNFTIDQIQKGIDTNDNETTQLLNLALELWHEGDVETFLSVNSSEDENPELSTDDPKEAQLLNEYNEKLITQRDKGMADYIDKLLKAEGSSTYFVVVGSGHYISDHSVIDILKEKGYEITQIK